MGVSAAPAGGTARASVSGGMRSLFILLLFHFWLQVHDGFCSHPPPASAGEPLALALVERVGDFLGATLVTQGHGDGRRWEVMCDEIGRSAKGATV